MKKYTVKHLITSALLSLTALVVGYALLRTIVVAFCSFWNFQTACFTAAAEVGFAGRIYYLYAIYIQEIIVETHYQRVRYAIPVAI